MNGDRFKQPVDLQALHKMLGGSLIWAGIAFLLLMVVAFASIRVGRVSGEEVGIMLNKWNGNTTVITRSGATIYNGLTHDFFVLDKTLQTLEMSGQAGRGTVGSLKVKTVDGSDVNVDTKVQYRIDPERAELVIATSGPGAAYKKKWAMDYARSYCRNYLGALTTEQFYDASKRQAQIVLAQQALNKRLEPYGIRIDSILIPRKPRFYSEYEEMIKNKKLADQAVLEEQSKALAAKQKQQTLIVEETNKKNVAVEQFTGQMKQRIIAAEADAKKAQEGADAYYDRITIGAEATLYQLTKDAEGILARKTAEAEGLQALKKALEGEGGRNMVKLEYAKKLKGVKIDGKPFSVQSHIERFEHLKGAATTGRK